MAAMKPRTGDGPLEVTKEGRGIVMRVPLEGGGQPEAIDVPATLPRSILLAVEEEQFVRAARLEQNDRRISAAPMQASSRLTSYSIGADLVVEEARYG